MGSNSVMQDIRSLLSQGKSAAEVIALGYKPPTVYKVRRQFRRQQPNGRVPFQLMDQDRSIVDSKAQEGLSAEDAEFFRCLFEPAHEPAQYDALRTELDKARDRITELEREATKVEVLKERVHTLEAEAEAGVELRRRVQELERHLKNAGDSETALRQTNARWQTKFQAERAAREQADRQAKDYWDQTNKWQQAYEAVISKLEASMQETTELRAELQNLEPLKVWAGHPCCVCGKPMTGSVSRQLAAMLQQGMGHKRCLEGHASGLGKALLVGGTLWGLSQLGKR